MVGVASRLRERAADGRQRSVWHPAVALAVVTLVAAGTRAALLNQVMRRDEAHTFLTFADSLTSALTNYSAPNNHILHSVLVWLSTAALGGDPWAIRLPAFVFGVALVPTVYWWVSSTSEPRAGLVAAALVAGSSMLIEYSTMARGYTMVAVGFVVLLELSRRILEGRRIGLWAAWVLVGVLGFLTVPVFALPFAGVVMWMLLNVLLGGGHTPRKRALGSIGLAVVSVGVLTGVAYLPAIMTTGLASVVSNDFVAALPWSDLPRQWRQLSQAVEAFVVRDGLIAVTFPVLIALAVLCHRHSRLVPVSPAFVMVGAVFVVVLQQTPPPPRVWLFGWPLALGLAGIGFTILADRFPRLGRQPAAVPMGAVALASVMGLLVLGSGEVVDSREGGTFRDGPVAAEFLAGRLRERDRIVVESHPRHVLTYYLRRSGWEGRHLRRDYSEADRLHVIVYHPRPQDLSGVIAEAGVPHSQFTPPVVMHEFPETDVFVMKRKGNGETATSSE